MMDDQHRITVLAGSAKFEVPADQCEKYHMRKVKKVMNLMKARKRRAKG